MKKTIIKCLQEELAKGNIHGAGLFFSHNGEPVIEEEVGSFQRENPIDIGGLKEIVAILPAILKLVERRRKKIALNHPVAQYVPTFMGDEKEAIQIINLLTHSSGLPNYSYHSMKELNSVNPIFKPGSQVSYSQMNFQFLPTIFEQASEQDFETFLQNFIYDSLLMENTSIEWQNNGNFLVTSSLKDLSHFTKMIQNNGSFDYIRIIGAKALQLSKQSFTSFLNENRGLGWKIHKDYYGFTSHTGSSMWFNDKKKMHVIILMDSAERVDSSSIEEAVFELFDSYE